MMKAADKYLKTNKKRPYPDQTEKIKYRGAEDARKGIKQKTGRRGMH